MTGRGRQIPAVLLLLGGLLWSLPGSLAGARDPFPEVRPATRAEAVELLRLRTVEGSCLTPAIQTSKDAPFGTPPAVRRALALLEHGGAFPRSETIPGAGAATVRFTTDSGAADRIDPTDSDGNGRPDLLDATLEGLAAARALLVDRQRFPAPERFEVTLVELGSRRDGYTIDTIGRAARSIIALDSTPDDGPAGARRAAIHQYAHLVARAGAPGLPAAWEESFATWVGIAVDDGPNTAAMARLGDRLRALDDGLLTGGLEAAAGNAVWFAFLHEAYGPATVRATVEALARNPSTVTAMDRAIQATTVDDLAGAFREFHLWSVLIGSRADDQHFSFADRLTDVRFHSTSIGLPSLSVRANPPVAPLGATQIRIVPEERDGGLRLRFEGGFAARWQADLLLVLDGGDLHRLPMNLDPEGRGETTIPLQDVAEVILLVRSLESDDERARPYTFTAFRQRGYPFELASMNAWLLDESSPATLVVWETSSEQELIGFNILRRPETDGHEVVINPVWVPALGDPELATSYRFLDRSADPDVDYLYRLQAITSGGLTSTSDPVSPRRTTERTAID